MTELFAAYCANRDAIACGVKSQEGPFLELENPWSVISLPILGESNTANIW